MSTRPRAVRMAGMALAVAMLGGCVTGTDARNHRSATTPRPADPADLVSAFVSALRPDAPYRDPDRAERTEAADGLAALLDRIDRSAGSAEPAATPATEPAATPVPATRTPADRSAAPAAAGSGTPDTATRLLIRSGYTAAGGTDPVTGRRYLMFSTAPGAERPWGMLLVDPDTPVRWVVEVPHPNFDLKTEDLGVRLFRAVPGTLVMVAGAFRKAGGDAADVAHNPGSMFAHLATLLARRGLPQLQLHGYSDKNLPDADIVVSTGQAATGPEPRAVADALSAQRFDVCRAWERRCGRLEGTTNVQGQLAARLHSTFIHVELSWRVRRTGADRSRVVEALARVMGSGTGPPG